MSKSLYKKSRNPSLRPRRPHPSRRHRACAARDSAKWSRRSWEQRLCERHVRPLQRASQRWADVSIFGIDCAPAFGTISCAIRAAAVRLLVLRGLRNSAQTVGINRAQMRHFVSRSVALWPSKGFRDVVDDIRDPAHSVAAWLRLSHRRFAGSSAAGCRAAGADRQHCETRHPAP